MNQNNLLECNSPISPVVKSDDVNVDDEDTEFRPPEDLQPHEVVLSFDHILEQIFNVLETPDLLTCRLVSRRFLQFAHIPLGKKLDLMFYRYEQRGCKHNNRKPLSHLMELLKSSLPLPVSKSKSPSNINSFPCTHFNFHESQLGDDELQNFLNINGSSIRQLAVYSYGQGTTHENILMDHLFNLLTSQAPRLEKLTLAVHPTVEWQQGVQDHDPSTRTRRSPLHKSDPEYQQISSRCQSSHRKSCLKYLEIHGDGSAKIWELLFQLSPKLEEVWMACGNHMYLLQPVSRVYLLKKLRFTPVTPQRGLLRPDDLSHCFCFKTMEKISKDEYLGLRELRINFKNTISLCQTNSAFENKLVSVINRILDRSRETLEFLELDSVTFLREMKMPLSLPKLRKMKILFDRRYVENATIFPNEFSWAETFPGLTHVKIYSSGDITISRHFDSNLLTEILNYLDFKEDGKYIALSFGVRKVLLDESCFRYPIGRPTSPNIPLFVSQRIQRLFPNADIERTDFMTNF